MMNLQEMINDLDNDFVTFDKKNVLLDLVLEDGRYTMLFNYLNENGYKYTNDIKQLDLSSFNQLKMTIPDIPGVGETKINIYLSKLEEIRRKNYDELVVVENNQNNTSNNGVSTYLGSYQTSKNWSVFINLLNFGAGNEYIDIRQIKNDGTRGKGISIKKEDFSKFKDIINSISINSLLEMKNSEISENKTSESNDSRSLKELILENEDKIYNRFENEFGLAIKLFKAKIESLRTDGDIIKFLENPSILDIKKEQYDRIHSVGMKTAIDIKNDYNQSNVTYTSLNNLKVGELVNANTICCIANNFNVMLGMYYDSESKSLILKCQIKNGPYSDNWIEENKKLFYCLQNESDENYSKLSFSNKPNTVCKNIIFGYDLDTKVYLFYRYHKKEDYIYAGEVKLEKFANNNRAVIINVNC